MNPESLAKQLKNVLPIAMTGTVLEASGTTVRVAGFPAPVGAVAEIERFSGGGIPADVVGFRDTTAILFPHVAMFGVRRGDRVRLRHTSGWLALSENLLGQVLDANGRPIQPKPECDADQERVPFDREAPNALSRPRITTPLSTGVRAIDGILTLGEGQRVGIFAGSGVGKSVLLGMMARYSSADVIVIGLVGERGREVNDFIERDLGESGLRRSVLVVATSDESAVLRVRAAKTATAVAEFFRDRGKNVLLLMDSLTRFAMAQREIGLAAGEPGVRNGYPPSVFAQLPPLVERAGRTERGTITALYTVLVEGDDENEPIADTVRGLLDGHIWLSRKLAGSGHYPAIDILSSVSRLMPDICSKSQQEAARKIRRWISLWREHEDLINIGAYRSGTHPELDEAIAKRPLLEKFLCQPTEEPSNLDQAVRKMTEILGESWHSTSN
ncbi:MAG: FliI/YscN family ATPase [Planctomycetia bacterium]|nr:FliI/YscN family ATPase [Planctomycetia bacterium]